MQDIPRNELLDKLAAGWKVRRKSWGGGTWTKNQLQGKPIINWDEILEDDWEGEPPEPVCTANGCSIVHAFERLREGAAFIRRSSWPEGRRTYLMADRFEIHIDELLALDWEVWR